jgi:hypothetical protein
MSGRPIYPPVETQYGEEAKNPFGIERIRNLLKSSQDTLHSRLVRRRYLCRMVVALGIRRTLAMMRFPALLSKASSLY